MSLFEPPPQAPPPSTFTTEDLQKCVAREVAMRQSCYKKWEKVDSLDKLSPARQRELALMQAVGERLAPVLTADEQQALANVNRVLSGDGSSPESDLGAWGHCGEVDVPVLLTLISRLTT